MKKIYGGNKWQRQWRNRNIKWRGNEAYVRRGAVSRRMSENNGG